MPFFQDFFCLTFMNWRSIAALSVSSKAGNKYSSLFWILTCVYPRFFGTVVAFENYLLFRVL
nr:serine/threonine-protein kinase AtPK2/AtPK19 [Ipomoea batatas]